MADPHPHQHRTHQPRHRTPQRCPTCQGDLHPIGLACDDCGTRVSGDFEGCDFCSLSTAQLDLLRVFLAARGNVKELERHLGVSYPTARARLDGLLTELGITASGPARPTRRELLDAVRRGELSTDDAMAELGGGS